MYTIYNVLIRVLGLFGEYSHAFFSGYLEAFAICLVPLPLYRAPLPPCPVGPAPALSHLQPCLVLLLPALYSLLVTTLISWHTAVWLISKAVVCGRSHPYWHRDHVGHLTVECGTALMTSCCDCSRVGWFWAQGGILQGKFPGTEA